MGTTVTVCSQLEHWSAVKFTIPKRAVSSHCMKYVLTVTVLNFTADQCSSVATPVDEASQVIDISYKCPLALSSVHGIVNFTAAHASCVRNSYRVLSASHKQSITITTLQKAVHHVQTAFGVSPGSYGGTHLPAGSVPMHGLPVSLLLGWHHTGANSLEGMCDCHGKGQWAFITNTNVKAPQKLIA